MKFSFIISLIGGVVLFVAVAGIFYGLSSLGVFHAIEKTVGLVTGSKDSTGTNAKSWFSSSTVLGYTIIADVIDVVMVTALATIGAVIYNLVTAVSGGIEVTLKETD
jgi:hypothetical protein